MVLPLMKGTGYALYPAALVGLAGMLGAGTTAADVPALRRARGRAFVGLTALWSAVSDTFGRTAFTTPGGVSPTASGGIVGNVLTDPGSVPLLPVAGVPPAPAVHVRPPPAAAPGVRHLRRARLGGVRLVRGQVPAVGLRRDRRSRCSRASRCARWPSARERRGLRSRGWELAVLLIAIAGVIGGVEAAYVTIHPAPGRGRAGALRVHRHGPAGHDRRRGLPRRSGAAGRPPWPRGGWAP